MAIDTAVVLAAGEGTRLRPLTQHRPKPMLPAGCRPILEHVFDALLDAGITRIHVVVGYKRDRVQDHFGPDYRGVTLDYVVQEKQLGSGHALLRAADRLDGPFLVVNGDQIVGGGIIEDVLAAHAEADGEVLGSLALLSSKDVGEYGGVRIEDDHVAEIVEKPETNGSYRLNAGVYAFDPALLDRLAGIELTEGELALPGALTRLVTERDEVIQGVVAEGVWMDATYPWDLLTVVQDLAAHGMLGVERGDDVRIHDSATVHETAVLREPVAISEDCQVGPGAVLGPFTCLNQNVTVGANAVVETSVLDDDTRVGANSILIDAVTGQGVHAGPANTVEGGPADVRVNNEVFEDRNLGALLADRVRTRGGVNFAPGTLVGPGATIDTGVVASGVIREDAEVVR